MREGLKAYDKAVESGKDFGEALKEALLAMMATMGKEKDDFSKYEQAISRLTNQIQDALLKETKKEGAEAVKKYHEAQKKEKLMKIFKWIGVAIMAIVAGIMMATGNIAAAILLVGLTIATATGGMQKLTDKLGSAIADSLGDSAKDKLIGKILAAVIVTVIVAVLGAGVGAIDGALSAADEAGSIAATEGADAAGDAATLGRKILKIVKTVLGVFKKIANKLPNWGKGAMAFGTNELSQSGFFQNLTALCMIDNHKMSEKEKKMIETIVQVITSLILMLASGSAMSSLSETAGVGMGAKIARGIKNFTNLSDSQLAGIQVGTGITAGLADVGDNTGTGITSIELGMIIEQIGKLQSELDLNQVRLSQLDTISKNDIKNFDTAMKQMTETQQAVNKGINETYGAASQFELRG